jgi:hypothetical protein
MNELSRVRFFMILLLGSSLLLAGCKESPAYVKPGPLFSAEAAPGKAEVYVYWLREEQGRLRQVSIIPCKGGVESSEILPDGYASFAVEPGPSCFQAVAFWDMGLKHVGFGHVGIDDSSMSETLAEVEVQAEPGHSSYIRLAQKPGFFRSKYDLLQVEPDAARAQIRRCRRSIPLSDQEMASRIR